MLRTHQFTTIRCALLVGVLGASLAASAGGTEQKNEAAFLRVPSAAGARASSTVINQRAHYPGTPGDYALAVYMRDAMRHLGLRAWIESFADTVYTPRVLQLQMLSSPVVTFDLREQRIAADPDGSRPDAGLPFNAGSASGDVRAPIVYVARGLDADYAVLARAGASVRGRIVLIRYGAEYRGNLASRAAAHGAAGVIFYSDPKDGDGYSHGPAYPNGRYRPAGVVQRGDVMGSDNLPLHIPTLPVTALVAQRLLAAIVGPAGPRGWAGALPVRYAVGVSRTRVRLHVEMNVRRARLWNTIGEIAGSDPKQMIVMGGHRDAWVYGVTDDGSGISTLLEVARGLGALHREGWTPRRSIRIAGWDGEEIGELGSAAYVAMHRSELAHGCVAYINTDESASGPDFGAAAAGALLAVTRPAVSQVLGIAKPEIDVPSGGSDFESFIYALGTPIIDLGYDGPFGTYHSPYDDLQYAQRFADPGFVHHRTIAQTIGLIAMRLADAPDVGYRFVPYVKVLLTGTAALIKQAAAANLSLRPSLGIAIRRFVVAANAYDARTGPHDAAGALSAAQQLDLLAYSANGYASVAFPKLAAAVSTGKQSALDAAVGDTVASLNAVSALLARG